MSCAADELAADAAELKELISFFRTEDEGALQPEEVKKTPETVTCQPSERRKPPSKWKQAFAVKQTACLATNGTHTYREDGFEEF